MPQAYPIQSPAEIGRSRIPARIARLSIWVLLSLFALTHAAGADGLSESLRSLYRGDPIKAASLAEEFLKAHPDSADGRVTLAQAKMAVGDFDAAYTRLSEAIRIDPKNVDALYHFSKLCAILSQVENQRLFTMAPDNYRVHQLMAESYLAQQDLAKAEEAYQSALKANPKSVTVLVALGDMKRGELGAGPESDLGAAAPTRYEAAIEFYTRALKIDPASYEAHYGLGVCYLNTRKGLEAVKQFRKVVEIEPRSALAHLALGRALFSVDQAAEAVDDLKAAVTLDPRMRQAYFLLGRAYQKIGQADLAQQALARERELRQAEFLANQEMMSTAGLPSPAEPAKEPADKN